MDKSSLIQSISMSNKVESPFQIGYEKEFLLTALSPQQEIYNLMDIGDDIIQYSKEKMTNDNLYLTSEYSRSLMEIITPPFDVEDAIEGLKIVNNLYSDIHYYLEAITLKYTALKKYNLMLSDQGSSPSHTYMSKEGGIYSGNVHQSSLVLEEYKEFVEKNQYISWKILEENMNEMFISNYNHINSFHFTFHPTYKKDGHNFDRYLKSIKHTLMLINNYKLQDIGNQEIQRAGKFTKLKYNFRDMFLEQLFKLVYNDTPSSIAISSNTQEFSEKSFIDFSLSLLKKENDYESVDELYSEWPALNLRPRIINDMFCLEIREFGSNFSHIAHDLIQDIINFDKATS